MGFIFGLAFMFLAISFSGKNTKKSVLFELPEFVEKSVFYKIAAKPKKDELVKQNNLKSLSFFYSKGNVETFKLSQEEVVIILKMLKGISNEKANELLQMRQIEEKQEPLFLKLKAFYEEELEVIEEKYKSEEAEIAILFERFKPKKSLKKPSPQELQKNSKKINVEAPINNITREDKPAKKGWFEF